MGILKLVAMDILWWHSNSFKTCEGKRSTRLVENLLLTSHGTHPLPGYMSPKRGHSDVQRLFSLILIFHFKSFHFGGVHRVQSMSRSISSMSNPILGIAPEHSRPIWDGRSFPACRPHRRSHCHGVAAPPPVLEGRGQIPDVSGWTPPWNVATSVK